MRARMSRYASETPEDWRRRSQGEDDLPEWAIRFRKTIRVVIGKPRLARPGPLKRGPLPAQPKYLTPP